MTLRNHLPAVHGQVGSHDGDIAVGRERIAREVARLCLDAVGNAVLGDEFARDLAHHGQVEHHGADGGMRLGSRDAVGPRAAADVHDALAAREIDLAHEAAACAHADRVGGIVVASRVGGREGLDRAHHLQVLGADVLAEPSPLVPLRLGEGDPGTHVAGLALDQEAFDIGGVLVTPLRLLQQAGRAQHHHQPLGVGRMDVERLGDLLVGPGAVADRREHADLDCCHECGGLAVGLGDVLQPNGGDRRAVRLWRLVRLGHGAPPDIVLREAKHASSGRETLASRIEIPPVWRETWHCSKFEIASDRIEARPGAAIVDFTPRPARYAKRSEDGPACLDRHSAADRHDAIEVS